MSENPYIALLGVIEWESFDYALRHHSNWNEIEDEEFHRLRNAYVEAGSKLEAWVDKISGDVSWDDEDD